MPHAQADLAHPDLTQRINALRQLHSATARPPTRGTNVHVHSNHSFGVFRSPCEAVWEARQAGIEVFGINDFYTTSGFAEFSAACSIVGIPAVLGLEAIAVDRELAAHGTLVNDPANPGKIYLCAKAVTQPDQPRAQVALARLRQFQEVRNQALIAKADEHFQRTIQAAGPVWGTIIALTPEGNTTERHVAKAILLHLQVLANGRPGVLEDLFHKVVGVPMKGSDADQQNTVRSNLLKTGKPCYAAEDPAAFPSVTELRAIFTDLGAIPTYPFLGNPLTGGETDVSAWCDRLEGWGFCALELIPSRNTDDRVAAVVAEANKRQWPIFDGTEHNTPVMESLTTKWGLDDRFRSAFRTSALVALGHQCLRLRGAPGFTDDVGRPIAGGFQRCLAAGGDLVKGLDFAGRG